MFGWLSTLFYQCGGACALEQATTLAVSEPRQNRPSLRVFHGYQLA